jgi:BTB/POZ domain-containing protein KCTD9
MPKRKPYNESCQVLRELQLIEGDALPELPAQHPRHDDEDLGVSFFRTQLKDARLEGLTLPRTFFGRSEIRGVSFRDTDLSQSTACWNDFIDVDFGGADLSEADLRASNFQRVSFRSAVLRGADLRRTSFTGCSFTDADLTGAKLNRSFLWLFRLSSGQRRTIDWQSAPGPEPEGG